MHIVKIACPLCNNVREYEFTDEQYKIYNDYTSGKINSMNGIHQPTYFKELLINGSCYFCQSKLFNTTTPWVDLGPDVGNCPNCDCTLHEKDIKNNRCPSCGCPLDEEVI